MDAINIVVQASTKVSSLGLSPNNWIAIGLGIFFICIISLLYRQRKEFHDRLSKLENAQIKIAQNTKITQPVPESTIQTKLPPSHREYIPDTYIKDRIIYLVDLIPPGSANPIIEKKIIENCEVRGPAMILAVGAVTLDSPSIDNLESFFVESSNRTISGVIGLQECTFRRCHFVQIGVIGTKEKIEIMKQAFMKHMLSSNPSTSHKEGA